MKVLLIANNPKANVPNEGYDLYVHFNSAPFWGVTPINQSIVINRLGDVVRSKKSFMYQAAHNGSIVRLSAPDEKVWACGNERLCREIEPNRFVCPNVDIDYPKGHSATTGYVAISFFVKRGDKVHLCGFNLKEASYYQTTRLHLPDYEIEKINEMVERGIVARH